MKGYMMNATPMWKHAMKRSIGPGAKVPLDELFEQYGAKHGLKEGEEFIEWLRTVKLKDNKMWKIVVEDEAAPEVVEEVQKSATSQDLVAPMVATKMTVEDIVGLSVRRAREILPGITDLTLLKYAMQEANQLTGKDSLCKVLRKRIRELNIAR